MGDPFQDEDASQSTDGNEREKCEVEFDGFGGYCVEIAAERDLYPVDNEEKPRPCSDELVFWHAHGEEVYYHDRACGVGHHGGQAGDEAEDSGKGPVRVDGPLFLGGFSALLVCSEDEHCQDNASDDRF